MIKRSLTIKITINIERRDLTGKNKKEVNTMKLLHSQAIPRRIMIKVITKKRVTSKATTTNKKTLTRIEEEEVTKNNTIKSRKVDTLKAVAVEEAEGEVMVETISTLIKNMNLLHNVRINTVCKCYL
jgi:hypothetical protein